MAGLSSSPWITFLLISFVVLLWAVFLTVQKEMLWVSLTLDIIVVAVSFSVIFSEVQRHIGPDEGQDHPLSDMAMEK